MIINIFIPYPVENNGLALKDWLTLALPLVGTILILWDNNRRYAKEVRVKLYEKRMEVYERIRAFALLINSFQDAPDLKMSKVNDFSDYIRSARYLFPNKVQKYINDIIEQAANVAEAYSNLHEINKTNEGYNSTEGKATADNLIKEMRKFRDIIKLREDKFRSFIQIE